MQGTRSTTLSDYHERLNRVLVYIHQHFDGDLGLESLAAVACLSPHHFHRIFRAMVGEPLGQYLQRIRLEYAVMLLQTTRQSVMQIALAVGYESAAAFSRAFEQRFGLAPTECRNAHRLELQVRAAKLLESESMNLIPKILKREATQVAYVRNIGPYWEVGKAWQTLCAWAGPRGLLGPKTEYLGLSRDDPTVTAADRLRYDACVTLETPVAPEGPVGTLTLAPGTYAVFLHCGSFEGLAPLYQAIFKDWLPTSGRELADEPCFERYLNSPDHTAPQDLRTEIWLPVKPA